MADYYPLIARAIAALDATASGGQRREVYERARSALIAQLRGFDPPLSEADITHHRLSLEEAVRKVESEVAQRAREASRAGSSRSGDAFRAGTPRANPTRPGDQPSPARARPPAPPQQRNLKPEQPASSSSDLNPQPPPRPPQPSVGMQDPTLPPSRDR